MQVLFRNKMNVGIVITIGSILLSVSTPIFAYDEPDNFSAIKFGEDVRTQLPVCLNPTELADKYQRSGNFEKYKEELFARCYNPAINQPSLKIVMDNVGELKNMGEISRMVTKISYAQVNDKLERIQLTFSVRQADSLLTILKQRYGQPTSVREEPWQSQGGAKSTSTHAE